MDEKGGESVVCLFPPGVWGGVGAVGVQDPAVHSCQEGAMLKPIALPVFWDSTPYFPTETKLKWRLAPCLARRSRFS